MTDLGSTTCSAGSRPDAGPPPLSYADLAVDA